MAAREPLYLSLRPASFRGVSFQVDMSDLGVGRRTQVHEYPQRDKPYVEDLGRAAREIGVEAFVVGDDYIAQANALIAAIEEPGPGLLVHPWLGTMTVSLKDLGRVSYSQSLGLARVSLSFIESGELTFPSALDATQAQTRLAAVALEGAAVESFAERFGVDGFQDFVTAAANGALGDMMGIVASSEVDKVLGFSNSLAETFATAIALVSSPVTLGWKVMGAFGLSGLATSAAAWGNVARSFARVGRSMNTPATTTIYTPSRIQTNANTQAVYALGRQALIAQAVGASSLVGTSADSQVVDYANMIDVRDSILAAIDQEALTASDAVYDALQEARAKVWADLTARARDSARMTTLTPPEVLPALVVAYDTYTDAGRDAEIVARNGIRHPGFLPVEPLLVLTR